MNAHRPDFDQLVGSDLDPAERDRLARVHDLLIAAGPPPDLRDGMSAPSASGNVRTLRRWSRPLAIAAAFGVLALAVGVLAGEHWGGPATDFVVTMTGTGEAPGSNARLEIFEIDDAGNWPMEIRVTGLPPTASGRPYELWLTKGGTLAALCGGFLVDDDGTTVVPLNAPYRLIDFDGWVVVEEGSRTPLLST